MSLLRTIKRLFGIERKLRLTTPDGFRDQLDGAYLTARMLLGRDHKGGSVIYRVLRGEQRSASGDPCVFRNGKWQAGEASNRGRAEVYQIDGRISTRAMVHEWCHLILFSHGIDHNKHHEIMRRAGVWMGA